MEQETIVGPLLTDLYELTMVYAFWKAGKAFDTAVFELFFRSNPFSGEFTIFSGLNDCINFLQNFSFTENDIAYLRKVFPDDTDPTFFDFIGKIDLTGVTIWAIDEGTVVFPHVPLVVVRGPLAVCQLLETTLLNLVNYASLVTTYAARIRLAVGESKRLLEFGLRRAQGPNGGLSASHYSYIGGFDATSNVLAGKIFGIPVMGTHSHSYISAFSPIEMKTILKNVNFPSSASNSPLDSLEVSSATKFDVETIGLLSERWLHRLTSLLNVTADQVNLGEMNAFVNFSVAFPKNFVCLVDTYSVLKSGLPNFCSVALALQEFGFRPVGVRIDSGDLSFLSLAIREAFVKIADQFAMPWFKNLSVIASNDLNEETICSLNQQGHSIDSFAVGTHLVTCQKQPALGCVYKLVEKDGIPKAKLTENVNKSTIPGHKFAYRLFGRESIAMLDLMQSSEEEKPKIGERVLCRSAYHPTKLVYAVPTSIRELHQLVMSDGKIILEPVPIEKLKQRVKASLAELRFDHKRELNPTPYKVSLSEPLYKTTLNIWKDLVPKVVLS